MRVEVQILLDNSLKAYKMAQEYEKQKMVQLVQQRIKQHKNGLKTIGYGYADHFVEAGKEFLNICLKADN